MGPETRTDIPAEGQPLDTPPGPDSQEAIRRASGMDEMARLITSTCDGPGRIGEGHEWDEDADWDLVDHDNGD